MVAKNTLTSTITHSRLNQTTGEWVVVDFNAPKVKIPISFGKARVIAPKDWPQPRWLWHRGMRLAADKKNR